MNKVIALFLVAVVSVFPLAGCTTIAPDGTRIEIDEQAIAIAMEVVELYFAYQERERAADLEDAERDDERLQERIALLERLLGSEAAQDLLDRLIAARKSAAVVE